ncbi:MAG: hypothetical protein U9R29_09005 [Thermodesulfobacteriota bacterium]|nr:hypothetical protein [Thermodesulfobacteriota bacterium]
MHNLGSVGGVRNSPKALVRLDMVEKSAETGLWSVLDPLFRKALQHSVSDLVGLK